MRTLLTDPLRAPLDQILPAANVTYMPELAAAAPGVVGRALRLERPHVVISASAIDHAVGRVWRSVMPTGPLILVHPCGGAPDDVELQGLGITARSAEPSQHVEPVIAALMLAERLYLAADPVPALGPAAAGWPARATRVALVGAGIVNLMTAYSLVDAGYQVRVVDAGPDPRSGAAWTVFGCTMGGDDARMFTLTEADNYSNKRLDSPLGPDGLFRRPVSDLGWLIARPEAFTTQERDWVGRYESIPPWLAVSYTDDVFAFNRESWGHWQALMRAEPSLFDDVGLTTGVLRLYTDAGQWMEDIARQRRVGAFRRALVPREVAANYPALAAACENGAVAGGIEVVGFTVSVHRFVAKLVDLLEKHGTRFDWQCRVDGVIEDGTGRPAGLAASGGAISADHYVLSPGADGGSVLRGCRSEGLVHGVLGVWLTIPNLEPSLTRSLKIARKGHPAEDANVTIGRSPDGRAVLVVGSGYGYTGADPRNIDSEELAGLVDAVWDTVRRFFPAAYQATVDAGAPRAVRRWCVRPWTASSLGVFESRPTAQGGLLLVTGGHNTGGFAQSPSVARAVLDAFRGRFHPMHERYRPDRLARFHD